MRTRFLRYKTPSFESAALRAESRCFGRTKFFRVCGGLLALSPPIFTAAPRCTWYPCLAALRGNQLPRLVCCMNECRIARRCDAVLLPQSEKLLLAAPQACHGMCQ